MVTVEDGKRWGERLTFSSSSLS